MKLLILYTKNAKEVFNRKSAIGSYINCLGSILNANGIDVFLNGQPLSNPLNLALETTNPSKNIANRIKTLVPSFIKRFIRDRKHLISVDAFKNELLGSKISYDAILEFYNLGSDVGFAISNQQNIPLYITYDGPIIEEYTFFNNAKPFFLKQIMEREKTSLIHANKIVVYSNPMRTFVENISNNRSIYIHQNVDFTRFDQLSECKTFDSDEINICFIGSFLKWHQVDFLVNAFDFLLKNGIRANLFLVGDGVERKAIEQHVSYLNNEVKSKIHFTGFLDGEELYNLKRNMHLGIMPGSNWYGAPNKIFEYGAMKLAVVAPKTPTIEDLFSSNEVCFFEWKNQLSLNSALLNLCQNKNLIEKYSKILNNKIIDKYSEENTKLFYSNLLSSN